MDDYIIIVIVNNKIDLIINYLYKVIMFNVNDIEFIGFNRTLHCDAWVSKYYTYYVLDFNESGEMDFQMDDGPVQRLSGPVVFLTFPGPYFRFGRKDGGTWHHRFVSFKGPAADSYAERGLFPASTPVIKITDPVKYAESFDQLLRRLNSPVIKDYRTIHLLEELLLQLQEQPATASIDSPPVRNIKVTIATIEENPEKIWNLQKMARNDGMSYPHFRRLFQEQAGLPPGRFILNKRLQKAAEMLRTGQMEQAEIADKYRFFDIYHFAKAFKSHFGVPPGVYRKNHLLK